jgi:hypothetical protein
MQMQENDITQAEADKACLSERDAYEVLLAIKGAVSHSTQSESSRVSPDEQ